MNDLLNKLYIAMPNEVTGDIATNSIAKLVGTGNWTATVSSDAKSVVIESTDGSLITTDNAYAATSGKGLGLKLNENYEVEARNVLDATGKYSDVSYVQQLLVDNDRPVVSVGNTDSKILVDTKTPTNMKLNLKFSEPVQSLTAVGESKAKIYIDGNEVPVADITDVAYVGGVAPTTVGSQELANVAVDKLAKGTHTVAIVGAVDLNGNLLSNNAQTLSFTIADPADPETGVAPVINNVVQVADNAFKVVFNTTGVGIGSTTGTILTIKNGAYDATANDKKGAYVDMPLTNNDFGIGKKIVAKEMPKTATVPAHTEWVVTVDATADVDAAKLSYKGANVITKDIVVSNYENAVKAGKEYTTSLAFKKDTTAPVIARKADGSLKIAKTATAGEIAVEFTDAPFITDGNGLVEFAVDKDGISKPVTVKYTDKDGVTYSEEVTPTCADGKTLVLKVTNEKMLTTDGTKDLIPGTKYTIVLPDGVVKDAEEDITEDSTPDYVLLDGAHPFVGRTVDYTVPGATTAAGTVPQTTKGLIISGAEVKDATADFAKKVKDTNAVTIKDNQIVVVFDGEIDSTTVTNKNNYLLGGKVLPTGTTIEFRQVDIDNADNDNNVSTGAEKFALITLPDNVITLTGGQDFAVSGVANKSGYKMMPVTDIVKLTDNTQPKLAKVEVKDSNKLVLTFPETVELTTTDMTQLASNFKITANGKVVSLANATVDSVNKNQIVVTTADNFDNVGNLNVPVSVELKVNADGNMFISDLAGNKAAAVVVNK
ncbi:hypothetical protein CLLI_07020 [Clostridium liquoris]|jgi:hypothetical protein|uniref:Uncharacterized protein n=1 Tax=Clostridium liquoris TaxID=1289519 RepID=A0A2T0B7C4_9CLOT|nr:hypothetical protein [Clostridium liquoris]PRR79772.1 hypothetical protein CLLI_07020 [Clostridium liquoris]